MPCSKCLNTISVNHSKFKKMKRRSFIQRSSLVSVPLMLNGMSLSALAKNNLFKSFNGESDNVLVLIQLNGGNDGLNTIIPLDKYDILANVRSNILLSQNDIIPVDNDMAFHGRMSGIKSVYDDAKMAIIQDVAYPNQNRSHFRSTDIWTSGSPADEFWNTGWLGKYFDNRYPGYPEGYPNGDCPDPFALSISSSVSETCQGLSANFSLALNDPFGISPLTESEDTEVPDTPYGRELEFLRETIEQSNAYAENISEAAEKGNNLSNLYADNNTLAQKLKTIALLMSGGLKTKIYVANLGGFDTHAFQAEPGETGTGAHADLLGTVSEAVAAFQDDLKQLGIEEKVITMTFSEFGRRIRSNANSGTDHGTAAPMMLFGTCINPGFIGESPELPANPSVQDGVPMQFDFRSVYGSILIDWFDVDETEVKTILYEDFQYIPVINPCSISTSTDNIITTVESFETFSYPNPSRDWMTIAFDSKGENIRINIFDSRGQQLNTITNGFFPEGKKEVKVETRGLAPGNYFYQIVSETRTKTKAFIKI